eukprot:TRINITY_DN7652_c0_g1_i4.p1 TRINITY_DN7652_c0_g1~~TRINITY_DN7652_c0_g1_i4.p1  ORF type:complete len:129 (-),score=26.00 TRINITY_DN7652_c0_g1_i4:178-564(-)
MIRRPPRSTQGVSSAASDVYKRQVSTQSTWGHKDLIPFLPPEQQTTEGLIENLRSAQFLQGLNSLTAATYSEQIRALLISFGLDPSEVDTSQNGVEALLKALIKQYGPKQRLIIYFITFTFFLSLIHI